MRPSARRPFQIRFIAQMQIIMIGINRALRDGISVTIELPEDETGLTVGFQCGRSELTFLDRFDA
jgi:hypothetical protein